MNTPVIFQFSINVTGRSITNTMTVFSSVIRRPDNNWMAMKADAERNARQRVSQKFPQPFFTITDVVGIEMSHDGVIIVE
jgi:hypothetical protein